MSPTLNTGVALVWVLNGLFAKVLGLAPRHIEIVSKFVGEHAAKPTTVLIGIGEVVLAVIILSQWRPLLIARAQITLVLTMNVLEFHFARELLLWGPLNFLFAAVFCVVCFLNGHLQTQTR